MKIRILRDHSATLAHTFYLDGTATDPSPDTATVTILRADGTAIVTGAGATEAGQGRFTYVLDPQANLDRLTAEWTATFSAKIHKEIDLVEIVGGFYVTLAEIRSHATELANTAKYPNDRLVAARAWFEDKAEEFCGVAFVPRYGREFHDGDSTDNVLLRTRRPRKLLAATLDDVALTLADLKLYDHGEVRRKDGATFTMGDRNVVLAFEHGHDAPDGDLREGALEAIRHRLLATKTRGVPDRAVTMTTESGASFTLGLAGPNRPTGIPEVDAVLLAKRENRVVVR